MRDADKTVPMGWHQKKAHEEVDHIFQELMPKHGLTVREEQLRLSHEMLDALWGNQIALCDAGVGIGKTYAYLVAVHHERKIRKTSGKSFQNGKLSGGDLHLQYCASRSNPAKSTFRFCPGSC